MTELLSDISFSESLQQALHIARAIAGEYRQKKVAPAHLLKALLHEDSGLRPLLNRLGQDIYYLEEWAEVRIEDQRGGRPGRRPGTNGEDPLADLIAEADNIRMQLSDTEITPLHTLAAICTPGLAFTYEELRSFPLQRERLLEKTGIPETPTTATAAVTAATTNQALLKYCIDKSSLARQGKIDTITGRDKEIRRMSEILCRRMKPNVLIIGEPGVGKSALADGFALAILEGKVPQQLLPAVLFELDMGALIAGASYKGEVEDRLKSILKEVKQFDKAILFIDEIHMLLDKQGPAAGCANFLKPGLARGEVTVIGATTPDEYRKYIEKDDAFARRLEPLWLEEPDEQTAFRMLQAVLRYYVEHHAISVPEDVLMGSISLAKRYCRDRRLPDSALDLVDRTMAALRLANDTGKKEAEAAEKKYRQLCAAGAPTIEDWKWMVRQIKDQAGPLIYNRLGLEEPAITTAAQAKTHISAILEKLAGNSPRWILEQQDLAAIVADKTGIPIGKVQTHEQERLQNMEALLKQRIIGQDNAIASIAATIHESRTHLNKQGQPLGSFFFLGPTGTGKTELAKALAEFLFQDESFLLRYDMSEFKEEHSAALLYGAPPGYVGYEEGGLLVTQIRQQPYSVVLFDEIEKAHPSVFDIFLQVLADGKIHDKLGREGDFSNAIIVFTSNIGSQFISEAFHRGELPSQNDLKRQMDRHFRAEFLGRLTEIIPFAPMTEDMLQRILQVQLKDLYAALEAQGIGLTITPAAMLQLAHEGYSPEYGARPLAGAIRTYIRRPLARKMINGDLKDGDKIELSVDADGEFKWEKGNKSGARGI